MQGSCKIRPSSSLEDQKMGIEENSKHEQKPGIVTAMITADGFKRKNAKKKKEKKEGGGEGDIETLIGFAWLD